MSKENVEVVRAMMAAFLEGDYERSLLTFDPEVEGDFTHMPDGRMTRGRDELRREIVRWRGTWDGLETEVEDIRDGGENVVLLVRQVGTGKASGAQSEMRYGQVLGVREGSIVSMKTYLDQADALSAAGLLE
jgi:ketosteroid isomerase-like protein